MAECDSIVRAFGYSRSSRKQPKQWQKHQRGANRVSASLDGLPPNDCGARLDADVLIPVLLFESRVGCPSFRNGIFYVSHPNQLMNPKTSSEPDPQIALQHIRRPRHTCSMA